MADLNSKITNASQWDDFPFKLPPVPLMGRARKAMTDLICLAGMAAAKLGRIFRANRIPATPHKILIIRRGGLGDVLMATPVVRSLRAHYPSVKVIVLLRKQAAPALEGCPWVDQILEIPASVRGWLRLLHDLRKERIDVAIILHRFFAASLLAVLAGIPQRLGFEWKNHGFALTASVPFSHARSQTAQIVQLLTLMGKPAPAPHLELALGEEHVQSAQKLLESWGVDRGRPLVGLLPGGAETPGSSEPPRRWLPERFGQLADLLSRQGGIQVVMMQGPGDEPFVQAAVRTMSTQPLGIASGLSLRTFAALMKECDLVVVHDTGPMHIAASQDVPTMTIIGPSHPAYTPPRGKHDKVVWAGVPCAPCLGSEDFRFTSRWHGRKIFKCWRGTHECMTAITAEQVYEGVQQEIKRLKNVPTEEAVGPPPTFC